MPDRDLYLSLVITLAVIGLVLSVLAPSSPRHVAIGVALGILSIVHIAIGSARWRATRATGSLHSTGEAPPAQPIPNPGLAADC
jgi:hypothetical protein